MSAAQAIVEQVRGIVTNEPAMHRYTVTVRGPLEMDRLQYEQDFLCADFPDAKERAYRNADRQRRLWGPGYHVNIISCPVPN